MPTNTYTPIGSVTLATATSEVTFTVPTGYRDLVIVFQGTSSVDDQLSMRFNGDTGNNYNWVQIGADQGSGTFSSSQSSQNRLRIGYSSTSQGSHITQIQDASATDKHKTTLSRSNKGASDVRAVAGRWANTNAITSVTIIQDSGNIAIGAKIDMYGIVA